MPAGVSTQRDHACPFVDIDLEQDSCFLPRLRWTRTISDKQNRMGPTRLRQILDDRTDPAVALYEEDVTLLESRREFLPPTGCKLYATVAGPRQETREVLSNG